MRQWCSVGVADARPADSDRRGSIFGWCNRRSRLTMLLFQREGECVQLGCRPTKFFVVHLEGSSCPARCVSFSAIRLPLQPFCGCRGRRSAEQIEGKSGIKLSFEGLYQADWCP